MATKKTDTEHQDDPQTEPAATGDTTDAGHVHDYKLIVDKDGNPTPIVKGGHLANHKCNCGLEVWKA